MDDHLAELLGGAAIEIAAAQGISVAQAAQLIRDRLPRLRAKYQAAGAPYGDDDAGLAQWLTAQALDDPS